MNRVVCGLSDRGKEIDRLFKEWDRPDSPGCVLGVIQDGKMVYERGYGMANLEHNIPITSDSVFRICSVSKQFTAMCIAILSEKRLLSLDDGIRKYVPELPEYTEQITIRQLIHQVSGIRDYTFLFILSVLTMNQRIFDNIMKDDVLEMLARQKKLVFTPGDRYEYSNSNYFLLGLIVERVSGKSLRTFADESIFKPLGMQNTHYHDDSKMIVTNRAYGYAPKDDDGYELSISNCEVVGDGCVFTTINDLLLWDSNFYNNTLPGGNNLIATIETGGRLNDGDSHNYAFGLYRSKYKGLTCLDHGGSWVGFVAYMRRFPEQKFSVIVLGNHSLFPARQLANQIVDLFLESHLEKQEPAKKPKEGKLEEADIISKKVLDKIVGLYATPGSNLIEISRVDSNLSVQIKGMKDTSTSYKQVSKTRFHPLGGYIQNILEIDNLKSYRLGSVSQDGSLSVWTRISDRLTTDDMSNYTGYYYSREFDKTFWIKQTDEGTLMIRAQTSWSEEYELHKLDEDKLIFPLAQIKFTRSRQGVITGFVFHAKYGIHDIRFKKRKTS